MRVCFQNAEVFLNGRFQRLDFLIEDEKIADSGLHLQCDIVLDCTDYKIVPGFLDIHTHGGAGVDINAASIDDYEHLSLFIASHGGTGFLASILTDTPEQTEKAILTACAAMDRGLRGAKLLGIHLEGPFLNALFKGAMPEELLRAGDIDWIRQCQKLAKGRILYLTIAPEVGSNLEMIPALRELGIVVALGHSYATCRETRDAIEAGAQSITHLFNAMRPLHQHEVGIAGAALLEDRLFVELICDGFHLHPDTVCLINKCKPANKVIAITDCIMAAGLPDGKYKLGINDVVVEQGDARLSSGGVRAGSTLTMDRALRNYMQFTQQSLEEVLPIVTENPAALFRWENRGRLQPGFRADFVLLDQALQVQATYLEGKAIYQSDSLRRVYAEI